MNQVKKTKYDSKIDGSKTGSDETLVENFGEETEPAISRLLKEIFKEESKNSYHRIAATDEKVFLSREAFGYLLELVHKQSIDEYLFEKIVSLSMSIYQIMNKEVTKNVVQKITNVMFFTNPDAVTVKEIIDWVMDSDTASEKPIIN